MNIIKKQLGNNTSVCCGKIPSMLIVLCPYVYEQPPKVNALIVRHNDDIK